MPRVTIDGREVEVPAGTTVIRAAEQLGVFIPRYCYHPGLSVAGNCRICLVQVEKLPKLQIACNLPVTDGMVVHTKSDEAEDGRRAVLEFLLANHPLDCPVCDQAGECDLQNFYMNFGLYDPRFREQKNKKKKAVQLGPHVMLDQERCILCSRCVRFTDEITQTGEFGIFNRGDSAELGLYPGETLDNPYSANVVDICPVGALTEGNFRFKARVWYLSGAPTVCNGCSRGCNIDMHFVLDRPHLNDGKRLARVKPRFNEDVNEWWLCDEGRYGFDWLDQDRMVEVRGPTDNGTQATWQRALSAIASACRSSEDPQPRIGVLASTQLTNEELFLIREVFQRGLGARVTASVEQPAAFSDDFLVTADRTPNTRGATLLGLAGPDALPAQELVDDARAGKLDVLWVFGHDLVQLFGEKQAREVVDNVALLAFSGTNKNATVDLAHWVLPSGAYVEKDGTFVNCDGRLQRVGMAFPPPGDAREDWRFLLQLAELLDLPMTWKDLAQVFDGMAEAEEAFAGRRLDDIGDAGISITTTEAVGAAEAKPEAGSR